MKAIQIDKIRIHCDTCHHEFEGTPEAWHNKACPECGTENIVNDEDMAIWNATIAGMNAINTLVGEVPDDTPAVSTFTVNTAPIRKKS